MTPTAQAAILLTGAAPLLLLVGEIGMLDWFFRTDPLPGFVRDLAVGLITVVLGIPAGLAVSRRIQQSTDRDRKVSLLRASRRALCLNIELLRSMVTFCGPFVKSLPSFFVDTTMLAATTRDRHDLFEPHTAAAVDRAYYELMHAQRRLDMLIEEKRALSVAGPLDSAPVRHPIIEGELTELRCYVETAWMAERLTAQFPEQMPIEYAMFAGTKRAFLGLAVGLTTRDADVSTAPAARPDLAAIALCRHAIEAIDRELTDLGEALSESPEQRSNDSQVP